MVAMRRDGSRASRGVVVDVNPNHPQIMKVLLLLFLFLLILPADWPQFRGPNGQGHSDERGLPLTWSETKNVRWKVPIPGKGWSSPVIQGDRTHGQGSLEESARRVPGLYNAASRRVARR